MAFETAALLTVALVSMKEYVVEQLGLPAVGPMSHNFAAELESSQGTAAGYN